MAMRHARASCVRLYCPSAMVEMFYICTDMVSISHSWLLSNRNVAGETEETAA